MSIEDYFTTSFSVERNTQTKTTMGGHTDSWSAILSDQLGCFRPLKMSAGEQVMYGGEKVVVDYILYCKVIGILEKDRVVSGDVYYDVKFVHNPMNFDKFLQVELKKVS